VPVDEAVNIEWQLHCICFPAGGASHSFASLGDTIPSPSPLFSAVMTIPPTSMRARVAPAAKAAFMARVTSCRRNVLGPRDKSRSSMRPRRLELERRVEVHHEQSQGVWDWLCLHLSPPITSGRLRRRIIQACLAHTADHDVAVDFFDASERI
jgi:hypothetical protein